MGFLGGVKSIGYVRDICTTRKSFCRQSSGDRRRVHYRRGLGVMRTSGSLLGRLAANHQYRDDDRDVPDGIRTHALAKQVVGKGIRVNAVAPGPVWTPLQPSGGQPPDKIPDFGSEVPMKRPGQPAELAPIYVLLASQESSFVTGEVYGVTGGNHLT
jgi:hypothetical protein